jgi:glutamyl-tRNA synthetase
MASAAVRGRFAPSPTGALHLGNARTALLAWLDARQAGGGFVLRIEDLDRARTQPGAEAQLLSDLSWLGIDWDEGPDREGAFAPYRQSLRGARYDEAIDRLLADGAAFLCACSRLDVARAATAPHDHATRGAADDHGPRYPGTCRGRAPAEVWARAASQGRNPAVRFDGRGARIEIADEIHGRVFPGPDGVDDFVLRRADGAAAYQLAVVVDDAAMRVTRVVRGDDLLGSTPRQVALYRALRLAPPAFAHVPLVLAPGGEPLAKRQRPRSILSLRESGVGAETVVGALAASAGLGTAGEPTSARALVSGFSLAAVNRGAVTVDLP